MSRTKRDRVAAVFVEIKELVWLSTKCHADEKQFEHGKTTVSLSSGSKV